MSLLELISFTTARWIYQGRSHPKARKVAGPLWVSGGRWGRLIMSDGSSPPTPATIPEAVAVWLNQRWAQSCSSLALHQTLLSQPGGARALLSGHQHVTVGLCGGSAGASVSSCHVEGASCCWEMLGLSGWPSPVTPWDFTGNTGLQNCSLAQSIPV